MRETTKRAGVRASELGLDAGDLRYCAAIAACSTTSEDRAAAVVLIQAADDLEDEEARAELESYIQSQGEQLEALATTPVIDRLPDTFEPERERDRECCPYHLTGGNVYSACLPDIKRNAQEEADAIVSDIESIEPAAECCDVPDCNCADVFEGIADF